MQQFSISPNFPVFTGDAGQYPSHPETVGTPATPAQGASFAEMLIGVTPELISYVAPIDAEVGSHDPIPDLDALLSQLGSALDGIAPSAVPATGGQAEEAASPNSSENVATDLPTGAVTDPQIDPATSPPLAFAPLSPAYPTSVVVSPPASPEQGDGALAPASPFHVTPPDDASGAPLLASGDGFAVNSAGNPDRHAGSQGAPDSAPESRAPGMSGTDLPRAGIGNAGAGPVAGEPAAILSPSADPFRGVPAGTAHVAPRLAETSPAETRRTAPGPAATDPSHSPARPAEVPSAFPHAKISLPALPPGSPGGVLPGHHNTPRQPAVGGPGAVKPEVSAGAPGIQTPIRTLSISEAASWLGKTPSEGEAATSPLSGTEWKSVEISFATTGEPRGAAISPNSVVGHPDPTRAHPGLPNHVSRQIVEALRVNGAGQADLHLNPVELGRVRISLQSTDGGVTVQISAERPETLDLMRRNMDLLARDFRDSGIGGMTFSFSEDRRGGARGAISAPVTSPGSEAVTPDNAFGENRPALALHLGDRIDVRL